MASWLIYLTLHENWNCMKIFIGLRSDAIKKQLAMAL